MNVNRPENRGSVFAFYHITNSLGQGIGPWLGGFLIAEVGFESAMNFSIFWWLPAGIAFLFIALFIGKDRERLLDYFEKQAKEMEREARGE